MKVRTLCALGSLMVAVAVSAEPPPSDTPSVQVQLAPLERGSLPCIVTAYGSVEASASGQRRLSAPASTIVDEIDVRTGQSVSKGTPLIRLRPTPATTASYARAESAAQVAGQLVSRTRQLLDQHLATRQELAQAQQTQAEAQAELTALRSEGADGPQVLRSGFDAVVINVLVAPGDLIAEGAPLLDLALPQALVLRVGTVTAQAMRIRPGDGVEIKPIGGGPSFSAKVTLSGSSVDKDSGLVPVEIALPPGKLLPGQMAQADITVEQATGYRVPHAAVLVDDQGESYVVQANKSMTAHKVPVRVIDTYGNEDIVDGALVAGDALVVEGNYQLDDGMKVRLAAPSAKGQQ